MSGRVSALLVYAPTVGGSERFAREVHGGEERWKGESRKECGCTEEFG